MEKTESKDFSWIHLSDIHFGHSSQQERLRIDQKLTCDKILIDIKKMVDEVGKPDFIFMTGDIAFKSSKEEYKDAFTWISKLSKITGCNFNQIFIVPGNHDVDRSQVSEYMSRSQKKGLRENPHDIDEYFKSDLFKESLWPKLSTYANFIKDNFPSCNIDIKKPYWIFDSDDINIIGLNTCLLSYDNNDNPTNLCVGNTQLNDLTEKMSPNKLTIVLIHHPLNWLIDKNDISIQLQKHPHLLFSGHEHEQNIRVTNTVYQGGLIEFTAGAGSTKENEQAEHSYSWGKLNNEGIIYYPRVWNNKNKEFTEDLNTYKENMSSDGGVLTGYSNLPNKLSEWYGIENTSTKIEEEESCATSNSSLEDTEDKPQIIDYSSLMTQWMRKAMCYNQGEYIQFSWLASIYHQALRINKDKEPYNFELLKDSSDFLLTYLSRNFNKHFAENFIFLHEYFRLTKRISDVTPRICIKSNLHFDKWENEKIVTLARDDGSDNSGDADLNEFDYKNNSGFFFIKEKGSNYICNNIPKEVQENDYKNPRLISKNAKTYKINQSKSGIDQEWMKCWKKCDNTKETNPLSCYKSTLIVPITLINNSLDEEFINNFNIKDNQMNVDKTILGYLCFDHIDIDYFNSTDEDIGYFIADILSMYLITALNYTGASKTYTSSISLIQKYLSSK